MKNFQFDYENKILTLDDIVITEYLTQEDLRTIGYERSIDYQDNYSYTLTNKIKFKGNDFNVDVVFRGSSFQLLKIYLSKYEEVHEVEQRKFLNDLYEELNLPEFHQFGKFKVQLSRFNTLLIYFV